LPESSAKETSTPMKDLEKIAGDLLVDVSFAELSGNV
jgi:hypothetical protein